MNDQSGDSETSSAATRYRWTNDVLAGVIVLAHVGLLAAAATGHVEVPGRVWDVFVVEALLATTWAFGRETLSAISEIVPNPFGVQRETPPPVEGGTRRSRTEEDGES